MSAGKEIEQAVQQLSADDLAAFKSWFAAFDAAAWNREFEADAVAGRLNWLVEEARRDLEQGRCTDR